MRRGETRVPGGNLSVQRREPTNSTHIWRRIWESNPVGHIGERRVLSPLRHPCTPTPCTVTFLNSQWYHQSLIHFHNPTLKMHFVGFCWCPNCKWLGINFYKTNLNLIIESLCVSQNFLPMQMQTELTFSVLQLKEKIMLVATSLKSFRTHIANISPAFKYNASDLVVLLCFCTEFHRIMLIWAKFILDYVRF